MSLFSNSASITRYKVHGKIKPPVLETVADGLTTHTISDIDKQVSDMTVGWTSVEKPFQPNFSGSLFVYGNYFVFSLRIDKKNIAPKILKKHYAVEAAKRLADSGREYLSKSEKKNDKGSCYQYTEPAYTRNAEYLRCSMALRRFKCLVFFQSKSGQ